MTHHDDNPWHEMRERKDRRRRERRAHSHHGHHGHHHGRGHHWGPWFQGGFPFAPQAPQPPHMPHAPHPPQPPEPPFPFQGTDAAALMTAVAGLAQVAEIVARTGGGSAKESATEVIEGARKSLYRLLAEVDAEEPPAA